jgi:two-component system, NarL family, sensor kinase
MDPVRFFVYLQLLVTIFLVVLLWCLYARLRKQEFFRWWAWAWTASAAYLATASAILRLGPAWTSTKAVFVLAAQLCGFLQVPLLTFGAWSLFSLDKPTRKWRRLGLALSVVAALVSSGLAFQWREHPTVSYVIRSGPRTLALGAALFFCAVTFYRQWRKSRSSAALISCASCLLYGLNQVLYAFSYLEILLRPYGQPLRYVFRVLGRAGSIFSALDVVYVYGICLGIVLLLIEEHRRAELALLASTGESRAIAESNAALQAEIGERTRVEQVLRESEAKFRMMAETVACGIWIHQDDRLKYFNPQVEAITGYTAEELRSMDMWNLVHPDFRQALRARSRARLTGEAVPSRYMYQIVTRHGEARWLDFSAAVIQYEGKPAVLASAFDVTAAKRIEHQIKERTANLQALINNSPLGIAVMDENHCVQLCNPAFEKMFLFSQSEMLGKNLDPLIAPGMDEAPEITRRIQSGQGVHVTTVRYRKDRTPIDVELHGVPMILDGRLVGCYGIYQDISERKKAEEELRHLTFRVMRIQEEERARIASELHDDVSQRLGVLTFQLDQVLQDSVRGGSNFSEPLQSLAAMSHQLCSDIQQLTRHLHPSHVEIAGLVSAVSGFCVEYSRQNAFEIEFAHSRIPDSLPQEMKLCLYRVAQEAVHNAQKHSGCRRVRVELIGAADSIRLCVSDAGKGFELSNGRNREGLGLVSMTERVKSLGGQFRVHSRPGKGTVIEASIPLFRQAAAS